jgi:hypothetical protein
VLASLFQAGLPVQHDGDRRPFDDFILRPCNREKSAIGGNVVMEAERSRSPANDGKFEEFSRWTALEVIAQLNRDGHESPTGRNIEKLFTVAAPSWLAASAVRDPKLTSARRKRLNVDFVLSGLVRSVCDPARRAGCLRWIRRKLSAGCVKATMRIGYGFSIAG